MIYGVKGLAARIDRVIHDYDLSHQRKTKTGLLSSGEQTRVALAKSMLNSPRLLLLDEPTASIDPATARDIRALITGYVRHTQAGVLWTSHNMYEVAEVCDRVLFLSRGKILLSGEPEKLIVEHGVANLDELFIQVAHEHPATGESLA
jgi:ABC-2 type transport system ATP-binding protein